jgi:DNA-binding MarR family transcriptional regulator
MPGLIGRAASGLCDMLAEDTSDGWLTVSALARLRGVDKAAISRRVSRLEAAGELMTRAGAHGTKLINVSEFNHAVEMMTDAIQESNGLKARAARRDGEGGASPVGASAGPALSRAQTARTIAQARIAQLDLNERLGQLLPLDRAQEAARAAAERLRRAVDQMPGRAEEVASGQTSPFAADLRAALRRDPTGGRAYFKALARTQLAELSRVVAEFDSPASEDDDLGRAEGPAIVSGAMVSA